MIIEVEKEVKGEIVKVPVTKSTSADRIIDTWLYWMETGDYPWPNAFREGVSADVQELTHLNNAWREWRRAYADKP